jgi:hypothetical protein
MAKDDHYIGVLLEDIQSKLQAVAEGVSDLNTKADRTDIRLDKIEENTNIIPAQKAAIKDQTTQLNDHEQRIAALEAV